MKQQQHRKPPAGRRGRGANISREGASEKGGKMSDRGGDLSELRVDFIDSGKNQCSVLTTTTTTAAVSVAHGRRRCG